jgi:hypothetical protein
MAISWEYYFLHIKNKPFTIAIIKTGWQLIKAKRHKGESQGKKAKAKPQEPGTINYEL